MEISVDEFKRMKTDDKLVVLFENGNATRNELARTRSAQLWDRKVLYTFIGITTAVMVFFADLTVKYILHVGG